MSRSIKLLLAMSLIVVVLVPVAAIASHQFTDVPDSNIFHADITWLADSGVTKGCNPPTNTKYCPSDNVTREQMAAFMRRLATNKVVDAKTAMTADNADKLDGLDSSAFLGATDQAVDSDTVDGLHATDLVAAYGAVSDTFIDDFTSATFTSVIGVSATAPVDGFLFIVASLSGEDDATLAGSAAMNLRITIDGPAVHSSFEAVDIYWDEATEEFGDSTALTAVVPVTAGVHNVELEAREIGTGTFIEYRAISVLFTPFGSGAAIPVGVPDTGKNDANSPNG